MACPKCGCKEVYQHNSAWDPSEQDDEREQKCAACGAVFDIDDSADEEDEQDQAVNQLAPCRCGALTGSCNCAAMNPPGPPVVLGTAGVAPAAQTEGKS